VQPSANSLVQTYYFLQSKNLVFKHRHFDILLDCQADLATSLSTLLSAIITSLSP
jgi:hypothetical protein